MVSVGDQNDGCDIRPLIKWKDGACPQEDSQIVSLDASYYFSHKEYKYI